MDAPASIGIWCLSICQRIWQEIKKKFTTEIIYSNGKQVQGKAIRRLLSSVENLTVIINFEMKA